MDDKSDPRHLSGLIALKANISMPRDYLHEGDYRLAVELRVIEREIAEPNRTYMMGYKRNLELNNRKPKTMARRLQELRYLLIELKKDAKQATKEDIEDLVLKINKSEKAPISKDKLRLTLKNFYKWIYNSDIYPDLVRWIKLSNGEGKKLPASVLLTEDDIVSLIGACFNARDKALVALLWDSGMRVGELLGLKIQDVCFQKDVNYVRVSGKTGDRRMPIIFSTPYIANYLNDLRNGAKPTDSLFVIINHGKITERALDYPTVRKILRDLKARAKMEKRVYPHLFRHSRATFYANRITEQQLKAVFGWTGSSKMAATYVHLSGRDIDNAIFKANGIEGKEDLQKPKLTIKNCHKCNETNEATAKYCLRCGSPLDKDPLLHTVEVDKINEELKDIKAALGLLMANLDPETRKKLVSVVRSV